MTKNNIDAQSTIIGINKIIVKQQRIDERMYDAIRTYYYRKGRLPETLNELLRLKGVHDKDELRDYLNGVQWIKNMGFKMMIGEFIYEKGSEL